MSFVLAILTAPVGSVVYVGVSALGLAGGMVVARASLLRGWRSRSVWGLLSILINGMALAVAIAGYMGDSRRRDPKEVTAESQAVLRAALDAYHAQHGAYPQVTADTSGARQLLVALTTCSNSRAKLAMLARSQLSEEMICDGYGRPMRYVCQANPRDPPIIISAGGDGVFGTSDDIVDSANSHPKCNGYRGTHNSSR